MAVAIRLRREGTRNRAYYRIVVADSRSRRDGRFIEVIGTYDPLQKGENYTLNLAKANDWISKGARPSETVRSIIRKARRNAPEEEAEAAPEPERAKPPQRPAEAEAEVNAETIATAEADAENAALGNPKDESSG